MPPFFSLCSFSFRPSRLAAWCAVAVVLISAVQSEAKKLALVVGGSSEGPAAKNMFTKDFAGLRTTLEGRGWQTVVLFSVGDLNQTRPATTANIQTELSKLVQQCEAGDQALILFHGHGYPQIRSRTHHFLAEQQPSFNMDQLEMVLRENEEHGCQTAVIDLSCFSGNTQNLIAPKTCKMTLASRQYVSVCVDPGDASVFTAELVDQIGGNGEKNLQDIFLAARSKDRSSVNMPELSTLPIPGQAGWDFFLAQTDPERQRHSIAQTTGEEPTRLMTPSNSVSALSPEQSASQTRTQVLSGLRQTIRELQDPTSTATLMPLLDALNRELDTYLRLFLKREKAGPSTVNQVAQELRLQASQVLARERDFFDQYYLLTPASASTCSDFKL